MSAPLWITCHHEDDLPSLDHLQHLVTDAQHVVLCFPRTPVAPGISFDKQSLLQDLASHLPQFSVFDSGYRDTYTCVTIKKVIAAHDVLTHADAIVTAVRQFSQIAEYLIHSLADTLNLSPDAFGDRYMRLFLPGEAQEGKLNTDWTYCFHGSECQFENTTTGQILEIRLGFENECGVLDPYFFHRFLKTTPEFVSLASVFQDAFHDVHRAFEILELHGYLRHIPTQDRTATGFILANR